MKPFKTKILALFLILCMCFSAGATEKVVTIGGSSPTKDLTEFVTTDQTTDGNIWFVDSGMSASGDGKTWGSAFTTLDAAIGYTSAGDMIYVASGHAETLAAADGVDVDVAGLRIIGMGEGVYKPTFTFSATASEFVIGAANVTVENMRFVAGISDIVMGISIEAAGDNFTLRNCDFPKPSTNSFEFLDAIDVADGANNITVEGCTYFNDEGGAAANHFIEAGNGTAGPERLFVLNNYIKGDFAVSAIWSDEPCDEAMIANNVIINHTTGQHCIELTDTGTGAIVNNILYGDTEAAILDPGSMYIAGNQISTAIDNGAIPRWAIDLDLDHVPAVLSGTAGIATFPAAAAPANSVSMAEVLRDIWDVLRNGTGGTEPGTNLSIVDLINGSGSYIVVTSSVTSSQIPNNTQTAGAITGASSGGLVLIDIYANTDSTGLAGPTNFEISCDNAAGQTGAAAPLVLEAAGGLGADTSWAASSDATTEYLPVYLETGKKLYIHGDDAAGTGAGVVTITMVFQRVTNSATIAGADLSP